MIKCGVKLCCWSGWCNVRGAYSGASVVGFSHMRGCTNGYNLLLSWCWCCKFNLLCTWCTLSVSVWALLLRCIVCREIRRDRLMHILRNNGMTRLNPFVYYCLYFILLFYLYFIQDLYVLLWILCLNISINFRIKYLYNIFYYLLFVIIYYLSYVHKINAYIVGRTCLSTFKVENFGLWWNSV
jgi:hypothetical protein